LLLLVYIFSVIIDDNLLIMKKKIVPYIYIQGHVVLLLVHGDI